MLFLLVGCLLAVFDSVALNWEMYDRYQAELDVYQSVGVGREELQLVQQRVALALEFGDANLLNNVEVTMFGVKQPVFNERELLHMKDVAALFRLKNQIQTACHFLFLLSFLVGSFWSRSKKRRESPAEAFSGLIAIGLLALPVLLLLIWGRFDFEQVFVQFHHVFFTNDLWLLNPATDAMIRMYPQGFFQRIVEDIGLRAGYVLIFVGVLPLLAYPLSKGKRTDEARQDPNPGD